MGFQVHRALCHCQLSLFNPKACGTLHKFSSRVWSRGFPQGLFCDRSVTLPAFAVRCQLAPRGDLNGTQSREVTDNLHFLSGTFGGGVHQDGININGNITFYLSDWSLLPCFWWSLLVFFKSKQQATSYLMIWVSACIYIKTFGF